MNRRNVVFAGVFALLLVVGIQFVDVAMANFFPGDALIIYSPISRKVYTNTSVQLNIVADVANPTPEVVSITYRLDNNPNITLTCLKKTLRSPGHIDGSEFYVELLLENLAEGSHTLRAYSQDAADGQMSASVEFFVDRHYTSPLSVLSPVNTTYTTSEVPLTFVCRETNRLDGDFTRAGYILDGIGSNYIYDNLTLTGLSIGDHEIHLSVWTDIPSVFSETIYFTVSNQTPTLTPSIAPSPTSSRSIDSGDWSNPTSLTAIVIVIVLVAVASASLVYFKRRKGKP
jgi:hypothetical protein